MLLQTVIHLPPTSNKTAREEQTRKDGDFSPKRERASERKGKDHCCAVLVVKSTPLLVSFPSRFAARAGGCLGVGVSVRRVYADLREGKFCVRAFDGVRYLLIFLGRFFRVVLMLN